MRRGAQAVLFLAFLLPACATGTPDARATRLHALFADLHARGLFAGAVVVAEGDRIVYEGGFGMANRPLAAAFTPDTPADGGSLAKTMTAALVLQLDGEGRLDVHAPAQRLLPELPYPDVTLRHLLSHTSGIPIADYDWFDRFLPTGTIRTTEALLEVIGREKPPLAFAPGSAFEYSSLGFDLAALAAARAAGATYGELLRTRMFDPLGMTAAFLRPARLSEFPAPRTVGYASAAATETNEVFDFEAFHGGSNVYLSARDLHRWNEAFLEGGGIGLQAEPRLLEPARVAGSPSGLTLGSWYYAPDRSAFWYSGHLQGFHGEVLREPRTRRSIAYVSNNTLDIWLQKAIVRSVRAILEGATPETLNPPLAAAVRPEMRDSLAGVWHLADGTSLEIESAPATLTVARDGVRYRMVPVGPRFFYVPGLDLVLGFATGPDRGFATIFVGSNESSLRGTRAQQRVRLP
jgi:CubicO group peptidase (beta-lactamase class C family)